MAKSNKRQKFNLKCTVCGTLGYVTNKSVINTTTKLELMKYCSKCRKSTSHKEAKLPNPKPR